jgi:uncharacterized repeat protein (TIGR03803 family)
MGKLQFAKFFWMVGTFTMATAIGLSAQTFHSETIDGTPSHGPLIQSIDGNLYGTTWTSANCADCGEFYKVTPNGKLTDLYDFCSLPNCADGASPQAGLTLGINGNFYGAASGGGASSGGTIFELTPQAVLTTLYSFCSLPNCADGSFPTGGLVIARNGNFYGTTEDGGLTTYCIGGCGTVFELTPEGKLTTLYTFCPEQGCPDGARPNTALVQATDGSLYGTTNLGGTGAGVIFRLTLQGKMTTFYKFNVEAQGANPNNLIEAADGNLYGTTQNGGVTGGGTIFTITLDGKLTVLTTLCVQRDPSCISLPQAGLLQASDGNFYGTTIAGGTFGNGAIFQMTPRGKLTILHNFCPETCGAWLPVAPMTQGTDGTLYGTTWASSIQNYGTIFSGSMSLPPFIEPSPNFGGVGQTIGILGNNLAGATRVTFNGVPATFAIESGTFIRAIVPSGAATGAVKVTLQSQTLSSNVAFRVLP